MNMFTITTITLHVPFPQSSLKGHPHYDNCFQKMRSKLELCSEKIANISNSHHASPQTGRKSNMQCPHDLLALPHLLPGQCVSSVNYQVLKRGCKLYLNTKVIKKTS